MSASFSLRFEELDILLDDLGLPRWVYPYQIPSPSKTLDERARQRERTWRRLRADGLADRGGLRPDHQALLRSWTEPDVLLTQIAGVVDLETAFRYRAAWRGGAGVLSYLGEKGLVFEPHRPEHIVGELVAMLPDHPPIPLPTTTLRTEPPSPVSDPEQSEVRIYDEDPPAGSNADPRAAERFFASPVLRYGRITCTVTRSGREHQLGTPKWFDTEAGRFLMATDHLPNSGQRITLAPTDKPRLTSWLNERIAQR